MDSLKNEMDAVQRAEERATARWEHARRAVRRMFRQGLLDDEGADWLEQTNMADAATVVRVCVEAGTYKDIGEALQMNAGCALADLEACRSDFIDDQTERRLGL
jgi:hypothetical protein